jgi:hypothetical protein
MRTHTFTLTLAGVDVLTPEMAEVLFEATDHDCTPGSSGGVVTVYFDRGAERLGDAVGSAVNQVVQAGFRVARVEVEEAAAAR